MADNRIFAPFTDAHVDALNKHQQDPRRHPYTCRTHSDTPLSVERDGLCCTVPGCAYRQNWTHCPSITTRQYCTKDSPFPGGELEPGVIWEHVDTEEALPDWDGNIVPFHCPNCGLDFDVDMS